MSQDPKPFQPIFHFDVSADGAGAEPHSRGDKDDVIISLLQQLVAGQQQQIKLMAELNHQANAQQKQRMAELGQWKDANPYLADSCKIAAETLSRVQTEFLRNLTEEIVDNEDALLDGEFMLTEFVDRYGPRLAHLNGVLQVLSQLAAQPNPSNAQQQ